jgi:hypothetical protein
LTTEKNMYNPKRLEWHLDEERKDRTPQFSVVGLDKVASEAFAFRSIVLLLLSPRALTHQSELRGFSFGPDRQGALANGLHGLNPKNTALSTPESKRRTALIERLLKDQVHGGRQGLIYKRINPSWALGL